MSSDPALDFGARYGAWAVVAGASDGIGAEFVEQLAERGANLVLVARRAPLLEALAARLPTEARVVPMDLSTPDAGEQLSAATADLDVGLLVYNAGADDRNRPFVEQPIDDLRAMVQRNCATVVDACHRFGERLLARGRGGVVLVSSGAAWAGGANLAVYGATKAFDLVLGEALWAEWHDQGVDVLVPVLGATDTPSFRRLLASRGSALPEVADAALVVREVLDHLADGPTWSIGMPDPAGPSPFGPLPRRQAVELMTEAAAALHRASRD